MAGINFSYSAGRVPFRYMYTLEYIPVDGNFEDGTTAILREIGQDSDSPDSDSGSEMELESQHVRGQS